MARGTDNFDRFRVRVQVISGVALLVTLILYIDPLRLFVEGPRVSETLVGVIGTLILILLGISGATALQVWKNGGDNHADD